MLNKSLKLTKMYFWMNQLDLVIHQLLLLTYMLRTITNITKYEELSESANKQIIDERILHSSLLIQLLDKSQMERQTIRKHTLTNNNTYAHGPLSFFIYIGYRNTKRTTVRHIRLSINIYFSSLVVLGLKHNFNL